MKHQPNQPKVQSVEIAIIIAVAVIVTLAVIAYISMNNNTVSHAESLRSPHTSRPISRTSKGSYYPPSYVTIRFGDCMADNATGDIYSTPNPYCTVGNAQPVQPVQSVKNEENVKHNGHTARSADNDTTGSTSQDVQPAQPDNEQPVIIDDGGVIVPDQPDSDGSDHSQDTHTDNGNHYGNDKPDNNSQDVNNPHNGEQTYSDHHDNTGKDGKH